MLFLHCKNFGVERCASNVSIRTTIDGIKDNNNEGTKIRNTQCTLSFARRCFTVGEALSDLNFNTCRSHHCIENAVSLNLC